MIGQIFSRLTVLGDAGSNKHRKKLWLCQCSCGNEKVIVGSALRDGTTTSCGCSVIERARRLTKDFPNPGPRKHGHTTATYRSPTYYSWQNMKTRCTNTNVEHCKKYYIDRDITYDPAWESFSSFLHDMGERPKGTSLDRIDNDKGYYKENCRWADHHTQRMNQRRQHGNLQVSQGL